MLLLTGILSSITTAAILLLIIKLSEKRKKNRASSHQPENPNPQGEELLRLELHHRMKNQIQSIRSLLNLHRQQLPEDSSREVFTDCMDRLKPMEQINALLLQEDNRCSSLDLVPLITGIFKIYKLDHKDILIEQGFYVTHKMAVTLTSIVNEIVTNHIKHLPEDKQPGPIKMEIRELRKRKVISLTEPDHLQETAGEKSAGFGTTLIQAHAASAGITVSRTREKAGSYQWILQLPENSGTTENSCAPAKRNISCAS